MELILLSSTKSKSKTNKSTLIPIYSESAIIAYKTIYYCSIVIFRGDFFTHNFLLHAFKHVIRAVTILFKFTYLLPTFLSSVHSAVDAHISPHVLIQTRGHPVVINGKILCVRN